MEIQLDMDPPMFVHQETRDNAMCYQHRNDTVLPTQKPVLYKHTIRPI